MSKTKMQEARELIRAGRYNEARDILKTIDHPLAKEWLRKLNKTAPDTRKTNVYADDLDAPTNHPYEPHSGENSEWMRSVRETQTNWDVYHEKQVAGAKVQRAKARRKEILNLIFGLISIIFVLALILNAFFEAGQGNFRPLGYWLGFTFLLGLPLRLIIRLGIEDDVHPGFIQITIMVIITLVVMTLVEYVLYLNDLRVSEFVFDWNYFSSFMQSAMNSLNIKGMLLVILALLSVSSMAIPTDEEFSESISNGLRSGLRSGIIRGFFR